MAKFYANKVEEGSKILIGGISVRGDLWETKGKNGNDEA